MEQRSDSFPAQISSLNSRLIGIDCLLNISTWTCQRYLKFNIFKTKLLLFPPPNKQTNKQDLQSVLFEVISTPSFQLLKPNTWESAGTFFHTVNFIHCQILHLHHGSVSNHFQHLQRCDIDSLHHYLSLGMLESLINGASASTLNPVPSLNIEAKQNDPVKTYTRPQEPFGSKPSSGFLCHSN